MVKAAGMTFTLSLSFGVVAAAQDFKYVETKFQCKTSSSPQSLCCRYGFYTMGYHNQKNEMMCVESAFPKKPDAWEDQASTLQAGEAVRCPDGWAIAGYHDGTSTLICRKPKGKAAVEETSLQDPKQDGGSPTLDEGMHVCPAGYVMVGIHQQKNRFWCSKPLQ